MNVFCKQKLLWIVTSRWCKHAQKKKWEKGIVTDDSAVCFLAAVVNGSHQSGENSIKTHLQLSPGRILNGYKICISIAVCVSAEQIDWVEARTAQYGLTEINTAVDPPSTLSVRTEAPDWSRPTNALFTCTILLWKYQFALRVSELYCKNFLYLFVFLYWSSL